MKPVMEHVKHASLMYEFNATEYGARGGNLTNVKCGGEHLYHGHGAFIPKENELDIEHAERVRRHRYIMLARRIGSRARYHVYDGSLFNETDGRVNEHGLAEMLEEDEAERARGYDVNDPNYYGYVDADDDDTDTLECIANALQRAEARRLFDYLADTLSAYERDRRRNADAFSAYARMEASKPSRRREAMACYVIGWNEHVQACYDALIVLIGEHNCYGLRTVLPRELYEYTHAPKQAR